MAFQRIHPEDGSIVGLFSVYGTAKHILDALPDEIQVVADEKGACYNAINPNLVAFLAEDLTNLVAEVVASIINAGSEREAVQESLFPYVYRELQGWRPDEDDEWRADP